jgi:hypothetical protein
MKEYIPREDTLYELEQNTVDCNPDHFALNTRDGFGNWSHNSGWNGGITAARCTIKAIPAADVVEVVRCRNCKYCYEEMPNALWCQGRGWPNGMVLQDGYCDKGKRREAAR